MPNEPSILIVEDDNIANMIYSELFKRYECRIDRVESAEAALEKFNHEHYDLLLVDIRLPKIDGFEFARHIRSTAKGKAIPIIGVSAITFSLVEDEFKKSGMDHYLEKPLALKDFENLLLSYCISLKNKADSVNQQYNRQ